MSKTGRLGLPYILQAQAQKEVTHNQALKILDVYVNTVVEDIVDELPATSNDGDIYITGRGKLAQYNGGSWTYYQPLQFMEVWVKDKQTKMIFNGKKWVDFISLLQAKDQEEQNNGKR